ncbi:cysteine desulfurase family protein [Robertkochia solimangrovi]|uniref:cysteine desulfurase family protein n=1 Tax=Robertkochia solimangrovi TaxID=2213046 RepID=UPI00117DD8E4|nr:cysteine desulfurase family protein [Robertkochia solimangrovi]TRZ42228.1 IscS subfamily cysteine desulfurase [Robertkochia solimangrovi]
MKKEIIYLDHNATTPVDPRVVDAMLPYLYENYGNPSSDHYFGWYAADAVEQAREHVAGIVHANPGELYFTSGATEAINMAVIGYCMAGKHRGNHVVTCKTEHSAVLETFKELENRGFEVTWLEVDANGNIAFEDLKNSLRENTILVSVMLANNETGLIMPIRKYSQWVRSRNIAFMTDLTQAVGKIRVDLKELDVDLAVFSSHKVNGPKGVGALYIRSEITSKINPRWFGGKQEKGIRPGTLNVPGIVGFGEACLLAASEIVEKQEHLLELRTTLENALQELNGVHINASTEDRLPNTTNVTFQGIDGSKLLRQLNRLAVSRGSACSSNYVKPSHVLLAMGHSETNALASLRISTGMQTTKEDLLIAIHDIRKANEQLTNVIYE